MTTRYEPATNKTPSDLSGIFKGGNANQYIDSARETMNVLEKWKFDLAQSEEIRKQVFAIAQDVLIKQREQMEHKLMLSLDIEKKRLLFEYLKHVEETQENLVKCSSQAAASLTDVMYETIKENLKSKNKIIKSLKEMKNKGEINNEDYNIEYNRITEWSKSSRENVCKKVALILEKQGEAFGKTVELFKTEHKL